MYNTFSLGMYHFKQHSIMVDTFKCFFVLAITLHCELGVIRDQTHGHTLGEYPFQCRVYTAQLLKNMLFYIVQVWE